jgi:hydroxyethylthiazole kinase-like uncharacterized protein yjeF
MPAHAETSLYTSAQVRRIDRDAIVHLNVSAFELMQRAAAAAFALLRRRWPHARRIVLLAGVGNNGGDAFLLGLLALNDGFVVEAIALPGQAAGDALRARVAFAGAGGHIIEAEATTPLPLADVIVDGLFGTGLARPLQDIAAALVGQVNASQWPVFALDVPSGLDADTGVQLGTAIHAQLTLSFVAWKRGLFTADGADCCGVRELDTLGLPHMARDGVAADAELLDASLAALLAPRRDNANKGMFGHVLAMGGDHGMAGAIHLCGEAALRCGAGLVSIATRSENVLALNAARPELMAHAADDVGAIGTLIERASILAIGPGMGQAEWGAALFAAALACDKPRVFDADALNLLAKTPRRLSARDVLTPHPGEAARLLACDIASVQADRYGAARELAARYASVVVLKGAGSLVAAPDGHVAVCPWGNPGMASGGMGDLLTGVIAALLAQGLPAWDAARLGVAMHARAGDRAAGHAPRGMIASDLLMPLRELANGLG